jgi:hypothetical protein
MDLLLSVLVLGLFLVPLAISRNNIILMAADAMALRDARVLAAQKIGELELENLDELTGSSGDFGEDHPGFYWQMAVETVPLDEVVDLEPASDPEEEEEEILYPETETEEGEPEYEVVKLALVVRHVADESRVGIEEDEEMLPEGEKRIRPADRIVIVRYFLREVEEE